MLQHRPVIRVDVEAVVAAAGEPAFAVDAANRIIALNQDAETLLGVRAGEVLGRQCAQVIGGRDGKGRLICTTPCPALAALRRGDRMETREVELQRADGMTVWVTMCSIIVGGESPCIIHLLRDVTLDHNRKAFIQQVLQAALALGTDDGAVAATPDGHRGGPIVLSPRQTEVLRLLAAGARTQSIAQILGISPATVRNHIQQIMISLGAHSRVEAIVKAIQRRLL